MKLISRKEAKALGLKRYFTGKPCKHGHVAERLVSTRACAVCNLGHGAVCNLGHGAAWRAENPEQERERKAAYSARNIEQVRARGAARRAENPQRAREATAAWRANSPERARALQAAWQKNNLGKCCAHTAKRNARKLRATPAWVDQSAIDAFYVEAARRRLTVDHIIPLQSPIVCGLHVPENLQLLTRAQNSSKGNRFSVDTASGA